MFPKINPKQSFPKLEEEILKFWKKEKIFEKSVNSRPKDKPYRFYDGPPFITGTPHYGSLLSSICKDVIPRYFTMQGKRCERVWGWDCHGLPIEEKVQKKLGLESNKDIEKIGVKKFIEECYNYTKNTSAEWEWYIDHIGRWVDFKNSYKTMDQDYMESVIHIFKKLWEKNLVYKGQRVSLYSWKLETPISNFEVAMDDSYEEISDPAITVMFPLKRKKGCGIEIMDKDGKILLLKREDDGKWARPGGKIEKNENFLDGAKRELFEETGLSIEIKKTIATYGLANLYEWENEMFSGNMNGEKIKLENTFSEYGFFSREEMEKLDLIVYAKPLHQEIKHLKNTYLLAWTTTPWTIPAHMCMALNKDISYCRVKYLENYFILATARVESVFKGKNYEIIETFMGDRLVGLSYNPPFSYYSDTDREKNHRVYHADFVTDKDGTGIAHEAPEFGDVDFEMAKNHSVHISNALDDAGYYTDEIKDYKGMHYSEANKIIPEKLKELGLLFKKESINHRVAMCPRSGTPLIYKAQDSWFINIKELKEKLIKENEGINWHPEHLKLGQFLKSMEVAPDWCISRTRYWGTPMPIWLGYDKSGIEKDMKVFGSREEIEKASNMKIKDLHKPYIDEISWEENELTYKRIPEVFDVWLDSGSMPFAGVHYPFENKKEIEDSYPADFIVEYIGQVRAWFYVMHVVGTAFFDKRSFTNVITTGIVHGSDGRKMSKSLGNYPDPRKTIESYGADAIRFYMMNGPLMSGNNMSFKEEGVEEVIKKVILPLWNTYSFFTTYANIDKFEPNKGNIYYCRHGETINNTKSIMNGGDAESELTEKGKKQAEEAGIRFGLQGIKIEKIICSSKKRSIDTGKLIKNQLGYEVNIEINENLNEQYSGKFLGKSHIEIAQEYNLDKNDKYAIRKIFKDKKYNLVEGFEEFDKRIVCELEKIKQKYENKNILIVAHSGTFRPINRVVRSLTMEQAHFSSASSPNAKIIKLPNYTKKNPLDKWIMSELHKLIKEVSFVMDNYRVNEATRAIINFMDGLTNWYIRRSRKRFWKSENDEDKIMAYETIYEVLVELNKIIAPFMPFISDYIYKNLTGNKSVHLDVFPFPVDSFIENDLNNNMDLCQKIVNLGLAWRSNRNIRVRQPLTSITIGTKLENYYLDIIKEELNVKKVLVVNLSEIAKKICKPNARLIGPKYSKDVKFIITEAKAGRFSEIDEYSVKVGDFVLKGNEFELAFEPGDKDYDIEAGFGMVIAMDSNITEELKLEGYARDIIRYIQEARKEIAYDVSDRIFISLESQDIILKNILEKFGDYIEKETLSKIKDDLKDFDLEKEIEMEEFLVKIGLKK